MSGDPPPVFINPKNLQGSLFVFDTHWLVRFRFSGKPPGGEGEGGREGGRGGRDIKSFDTWA